MHTAPCGRALESTTRFYCKPGSSEGPRACSSAAQCAFASEHLRPICTHSHAYTQIHTNTHARSLARSHAHQAAQAKVQQAAQQEELTAQRLVAEAHQRRVLELQAEVQSLEQAALASAGTVADSEGVVRRAQAERDAAVKASEMLREQLAKAQEELVLARAEQADKVHVVSMNWLACLHDASMGSCLLGACTRVSLCL